MRDYKNSDEGSRFGIALAILGGAAAGAIFTMLAAPKSGRETRQHLGKSFRRTKRKSAQLPEEIRNATSRAREALDSALADVEAQFR